MTTFTVDGQAYPTKDEIRNQILNDQVFAADALGIAINVLPGSDRYRAADAFAAVTSIAIANGKIARSALSPLTAQGDDLLQLAGVHGVYARAATKAAGFVIVKTSLVLGGPPTIVSIPNSFKCTAKSTGKRYQTLAAQTATLFSHIEVEALEAGDDGDLDAGEELTWDSSSVANLFQLCTVDSAGITGGEDTDTVEEVRERLLAKLAAPGVGGNNDHVVELARNASASIDSAYAYAAIQGPGSVDCAVVSTEDDRVVGVAGIAKANGALVSNLPGHWSVVVTTVNPQYVDVIFDTTLPLPANAGGAGGGWKDASPWPAERTQVTAYNSGTGVAEVDSTATPSIGNEIGIWDPDEAVMREYRVTSVGGVSGAWTITVDGGFKVDPTDAYVSAGAHSLTLYAQTALAAFKTLGPGEKTDSGSLLPRSRRHPPPDVRGPMNINSRIITRIESEYPEIALAYNSRFETGTSTPITQPALPATSADPPRIIVLKYLAFIPA